MAGVGMRSAIFKCVCVCVCVSVFLLGMRHLMERILIAEPFD